MNRRKYQEESTNVSIVSVSLRALQPGLQHTYTHTHQNAHTHTQQQNTLTIKHIEYISEIETDFPQSALSHTSSCERGEGPRPLNSTPVGRTTGS